MIIWIARLSPFPRTTTRIAIAMIATLAFGSSATAEPCNPVIDGTYCATQMPKRSNSKTTSKSRSSVNMPAIRNTTRDQLPSYDTPATWGGISFSNTGERCVGLMRRGRCK
jgi:hypothetical protein